MEKHKIFYCEITNCSKEAIDSLKWADCPKRIDCKVCELEESLKEKCNQPPSTGKFASMSMAQKKMALKERSHKNNQKKENVERRAWMWQNDIGIGGGGVG